ncbi:MAG: hypothetical protein HDR03_09095 [Lachnospiraceae bacterium]|nr:hypothetical protein [Lachnospiraceae bacterium]
MKIKIRITFMLGFIVVGTLCGCGTSTNGMESSYEELDVDYTINDDGTYTCDDNIYKYKLEVSGIEGKSQVTFIVLTNDTETSFEDVSYSLKKAQMSTGIPEFVILGWYNADAPSSDLPPMITLYDRDYVAPYMPLKELPDGYKYIGKLTEEQANDTGLAGCGMYAIMERDSLSDIYVYQECGTPIDENTLDSTTMQWAYVQWIVTQ